MMLVACPTGRNPRPLLALLLVGTLTAVHRTAAGQPTGGSGVDTSVCLEWQSTIGSECPTEARIAALVEEMLGHRVFARPPCDRVMEVSLALPSPDGRRIAKLRLRAQDGSLIGERELIADDPSCRSLAGPVALVMALMVETAKAHASLTVPADTRPAETARGYSIRSLAALNASWGLLPTVALGPSVGFGLPVSRWLAVRVDGTAWLPTRTRSAGRGGKFWAWQAGAALCPELKTRGAIHLAVCGGVQAGILYGTGSGLDYDLSTNRPIVEGEVGMLGSVPLFGPVALAARVGAAVPLLRPRFVYLEPSGPPHLVHRVHPVVLLAGMGFELRASASRKDGAQSP